MKRRKILGLIFLSLAIFIFSPFDDIIWFPLVVALNLPEIIIFYQIIGIIFLIIAIYLLGITKVIRQLSKVKLALLATAIVVTVIILWYLWKIGVLVL